MDSIELKGAGQPAQANSSAMDFESSREEAIHRVPDVEKQRYKAESIDQQFMARYGKKQQLKVRPSKLGHVRTNLLESAAVQLALLHRPGIWGHEDLGERAFVSQCACIIAVTYESASGMQFGLANGGPAGLIYGFLGAWCGATLQALVMAEMASM